MDTAPPQPAIVPKRVLLIVNEHSRRGRDLAADAQAAFEKAGIAVARHASTSR